MVYPPPHPSPPPKKKNETKRSKTKAKNNLYTFIHNKISYIQSSILPPPQKTQKKPPKNLC